MTRFSVPQVQGQDDPQLNIIRQDMSGGQNTRQQAEIIKENQAVGLTNVDITIPGQRQKRAGSILIGNDLGANQFEALHNFVIQGATDQLLGYESTNIRKWTGSGSWSAAIKSNFTASQTDIGIVSGKESGLTPDDIVIVQNGTDNAFRIDAAGNVQDLGDTNTSPPKSTVGAWFANRFWYLINDLFSYSDAYDSDYSGAFDRAANTYRIPVGEERFIAPTRDLGMIIGGQQGIWALDPSTTPSASDKPQPIVEFVGCVSKNGWAYVGDDIYFFAQDGLRELKRTVQDKLQTGVSFPLSFALKTEFENISWAHIANLSMKYFDNKLFISVPTGATTFSTWVYYPSYQAFVIIDGWSPTAMETYEVSGEERFYYAAQGDGTAFQGWTGFTDEGTTSTNGTAITYTEISREENFKQALIKKNGGEIELEARSIGENNSITVEARVDGGNYVTLGTMSLQSSDAPTLPVALPFTLAEDFVLHSKFHLDQLGAFRTIQFKFTNSDKNTSEIKIFGHKAVTYIEEYTNE